MEGGGTHRVRKGLIHHADIREGGAGLGHRGAGAQQVGDQLPGGEVDVAHLGAGGVDRVLLEAQTRHAEALFVHGLGVKGVAACGWAVHKGGHTQQGVVVGVGVAVGEFEGVAAGGEGGGFAEMGVEVEGAAEEGRAVGGGEGEGGTHGGNSFFGGVWAENGRDNRGKRKRSPRFWRGGMGDQGSVLSVRGNRWPLESSCLASWLISPSSRHSVSRSAVFSTIS